MPDPALARLGHVALETPDLEASLDFYRDAVGLEEVERRDSTVYLRAVDEFDHHSLSLTEAEEAGIDHIGWQTENQESLSRFADQLADEGLDVVWIEEGVEAGQGEAIRFETPHGHRFEFYAEMEKPDPPEERRSKLKNRVYSTPDNNPIAPYRIDHVQIWDPKAKECTEWMQEILDFRCQEFFDEADGTRWGTFLSACQAKIDLAIIQTGDESDPPGVHHVAYKVHDADDLFAAKDVMNELDIPTDGIGQHSISRAKFLYVRDPVSDHRIEFSGGGYLTFDPHWEPIAWKAGDVGDNDNHQWVGQIHSRKWNSY